MTVTPKQRPEPEAVVVGERVARPSEEKAEETAQFVTVLHSRVGSYPRGSILPASTFEYLPKLLELNAVEYNHEATEQFIAGNAIENESLIALQLAQTQVLPIAPWATASAANLLGAKYIPLNKSRGTWTVPIEPVENATKEVPFNPS